MGRPKASGVAGLYCVRSDYAVFGDDRFAAADDDALSGERLELGREVAGAAVFVDSGFVVAGPEVTKSGGGVSEQVVDDGQHRITDGDEHVVVEEHVLDVVGLQSGPPRWPRGRGCESCRLRAGWRSPRASSRRLPTCCWVRLFPARFLRLRIGVAGMTV